MQTPTQADPFDLLTDKERDVLKLLVEGEAHKGIARRLQIGMRTVELRRHKICRKLNVQSAVRLGYLAGLAEGERIHHRGTEDAERKEGGWENHRGPVAAGEGMAPEDCVVGREVEYSPSPGYWFRGRVAREPWQLGQGTWVTHLDDMEPAYGRLTGRSVEAGKRVKAAALSRLRSITTS